jgi:hypothetical protein
MRAAFGAVGGALAVAAMLVSYNIGAHSASSGLMTAPTTQMLVGPDGIARPYLVQAAQGGFGQAAPGQPYGWSPYTTTTPGAVTPVGYAYPAYQAPYPVQTQYTTERAVAQAPVRRVSTQRVSSEVKSAAVVAEERAADRRLGWRGRRARRGHGRQERARSRARPSAAARRPSTIR